MTNVSEVKRASLRLFTLQCECTGLVYMLNSGAAGANRSEAMKAQIQLEMENEKKMLEKATADAARCAGPQQVDLDAAPVAGKVLFRCPLISPDLRLPKEEMEKAIEAFLVSQLTEEPAMTAALMIYTLNNNQLVKACIETIEKYLDNIAAHPDEEKYRRIRVGNKMLQERVLALRGSEEFLQAAGFSRSKVEGADGSSDEFLVFDASAGSEEVSRRISELKEIMNSAERIRPELDRDARVFHPSPNAARIAVPDEFYRVTPEEIKREQQLKADAVEQFGMLRTRQMRERDRIRELRRYRYCLIRVRFPDGIVLQGTFLATDKLAAVVEFITENLVDDWIPFYLSTSTGQRLDSGSGETLAELDLAPASLVNFAFDAAVLADLISHIANEQGAGSVNVNGPFLKPHLMATIASL